MVVGIIIAVLILLVLFCVGIYNNLVRLRNNRENAFANIDVSSSNVQILYHSLYLQ